MNARPSQRPVRERWSVSTTMEGTCASLALPRSSPPMSHRTRFTPIWRMLPASLSIRALLVLSLWETAAWVSMCFQNRCQTACVNNRTLLSRVTESRVRRSRLCVKVIVVVVLGDIICEFWFLTLEWFRHKQVVFRKRSASVCAQTTVGVSLKSWQGSETSQLLSTVKRKRIEKALLRSGTQALTKRARIYEDPMSC